jgi:hypothetical protein
MGPRVRDELRLVLASQDSNLRMRGLHLLVSLVSQAQNGIRTLHDSGMLYVSPLFALLVDFLLAGDVPSALNAA